MKKEIKDLFTQKVINKAIEKQKQNISKVIIYLRVLANKKKVLVTMLDVIKVIDDKVTYQDMYVLLKESPTFVKVAPEMEEPKHIKAYLAHMKTKDRNYYNYDIYPDAIKEEGFGDQSSHGFVPTA